MELIESEKADKVFILDFLMEYQEFREKDVIVSSNIQDLESFCEQAWDASSKERKTLVVFDEIHNYGKKCPPIEILYRFGRHWNIEIIAASHRFADLPMITRSQTQQYYVFQVTEKCDLEFLRYSLSKEKVEQISNLADHKYVVLEF
ncbi:hypothetical protein ES702_07677 [subsurface metagenome]